MKGQEGNEWEEDREALLETFWLCSVRGIGPVSVRRLVEAAGGAARVKDLSRKTLEEVLGTARADALERGRQEKQRQAAFARYYKYRRNGIFFLPFWHAAYPKRLRQIADFPVALYGRGKLPREKKAAAIIGARECSAYGSWAARHFATALAAAGVTVVSGMARGVDGIAGRAALDAGGESVAVLGCGVDVCYPPENRDLYERLIREGCLVSEYPPHTEPSARLFPARNRIISGLSDLVLVTEAREKSGTLITVDLALEQGRDVFAVPGRITDACSGGCNRLIENGAGMATEPGRLLRELGMEENPDAKIRGGQKGSRLPSDACGKNVEQTQRARILRALDTQPKGPEEIWETLAEEQDAPSPSLEEILQELIGLCMEGRAGCAFGRYFLKDAGF